MNYNYLKYPILSTYPLHYYPIIIPNDWIKKNKLINYNKIQDFLEKKKNSENNINIESIYYLPSNLI